ncbi:Ig-like domain-containing protein [Mycobacterium hippophais]|uniref:Ig-like domain-containing protein n=1 Tax=Mycobacterium hippophais TaxID=3016340 RepID=UPI0038CDBC05
MASIGAFLGLVTASHPAGDTFTFTRPTATPCGTVSVASNGTWTYTPSAVGRRAAATTPGLTDTFEITVPPSNHGRGSGAPVCRRRTAAGVRVRRCSGSARGTGAR